MLNNKFYYRLVFSCLLKKALGLNILRLGRFYRWGITFTFVSTIPSCILKIDVII